MRITDVFLAFPSLILAIAFVAFLGPEHPQRDDRHRPLVVALVHAPRARHGRVAARAALRRGGARPWGWATCTIIARHILPNSFGPVIVQMTLDIGTVILAAAGLSFIGLGAQPPVAEWGLMISEGRDYILDQWWIGAFAGLAILILVLAFNLVGDGLRDVLDPRLEEVGGVDDAPQGARPQAAVPQHARRRQGAGRRRHQRARARDPRPRGRVRLRQDHHRARHPRPAAAAPGRDHRRRASLPRRGPPGQERQGDAGSPRPRDLHGVPGPAGIAQPRVPGRSPDRGRRPHPQGRVEA